MVFLQMLFIAQIILILWEVKGIGAQIDNLKPGGYFNIASAESVLGGIAQNSRSAKIQPSTQ